MKSLPAPQTNPVPAANLHYAREQSRVRVEFSDITQID